MPVKIRCSSCQKVLSVSDAARGKIVKCPACESKIRVPEGESQDAAEGSRTAANKVSNAKAGAKSVAKKAPKRERTEEDFLSDLDLGRMEDTSSRVCPKCGHESSFEDLECPKCGVEFSTGQLSAKAARRKNMRGPDPKEFFAVAFRESWEFLTKNKTFAWRTGLYWTLFNWLSLNCLLFAWLVCVNWPPRIFWTCMGVFFGLGTQGWYWYLNGKIIESTMAREKKPKKVPFDFILNVALGFKAMIWPIALTLPFAWVPGAQLLPILAFPVAQVHLQQRHVWPAWSFWHMLQATFRNLGACLYWLLMAFVSSLIVSIPLGLVLGLILASPDFLGWLTATGLSVHKWLMETAGESVDNVGFVGGMIIGAEVGLGTFLGLAPFCYAAAFPAVFLCKVNGLFAHYNRENLELITEMKPNTVAGFWARYCAFMIDSVILGAAGGVLFSITLGAMYLLAMLGAVGMALTLWSVAGLAYSVFTFLYFSKSESGPIKATIGKRSLGLIVLTEDGKQITFQQGISRYFARGLSSAIFKIGYMMAGFTEKKQTLHDMLTKTKVIFKGDDEASTR